MLLTKLARRFALLLVLPLGAFAADPTLLQMAMPDAQVLAGLQVTQAKGSAFGQYVLSHLSVNNTQLQEFVSQTGFDPRQDVSEIVISSNWKANTPDNRWLIAAHGTFNVNKITAAGVSNGATSTTYRGINLVTHASSSATQSANAFAFLDPATGLAGDIASVEAAIDRKLNNTPADSAIYSKAQQASANNDFWFVTLVPLSNFASSLPGSQLSGAMQGNLFAAINQASGGVRFGDTVTISAAAVTRSEKDAQSLVDVVKFFAGLVQLNRQKSDAAGQVATLLDTLQASASGNTTTISLSIPEAQLEQLLNNAGGQPHTRRASLRSN